MPDMKKMIIESAECPHELELLYRTNSSEFTKAFQEVFLEYPDSPILQVWHERLIFKQQNNSQTPSIAKPQWQFQDIGLTIVLALIAGTLAKLPHIVPSLNAELFYSRNIPGIIIGALILLVSLQNKRRWSFIITIFSFFFGTLLYLNLLPNRPHSQTINLACLYIPFFFWSLLGIAYLGSEWRWLQNRMNYLKYNGELLIYSTILLLGGVVLTLLTVWLFQIIKINIFDWYHNNAVIYGAIASPIVATLLIERVIPRHLKIAPLLAKVFTPLFLLTVVIYLFVMIFNHKSPFTDRNFLIALNSLLLIVLGLFIFSISGRSPTETRDVSDIMSIALVSVTLLIDVIALAAILSRLSLYGFTPNRLAVLGTNLLAFCHLTGIAYLYIQILRNKIAFESLTRWIVGYIPAYALWSLFVGIGFPLLFSFF